MQTLSQTEPPCVPGETLLDSVESSIQEGQITQGLDALFDGLSEARETMDRDSWLAFGRELRTRHPLRHVVFEDPLTRRAFFKPRGYAGDAVMMDYLYGVHYSHAAENDASDLGREIYRYVQSRPAGHAVRFRRDHIAGLIDDLATEKAGTSILAIAAGHLREAEISFALATGAVGRFVALDADRESLAEVSLHYAPLGVETVPGSVRQILARKVKLGSFDFVYAAGLYDSLNDAVAKTLTARMFEMTNPGGQLLVANFTPGVKDRAYMEACMDWDLVYRDEYDMSTLLEGIPLGQVEKHEIYTDPTDSMVYLMVRKAR